MKKRVALFGCTRDLLKRGMRVEFETACSASQLHSHVLNVSVNLQVGLRLSQSSPKYSCGVICAIFSAYIMNDEENFAFPCEFFYFPAGETGCERLLDSTNTFVHIQYD